MSKFDVLYNTLTANGWSITGAEGCKMKSPDGIKFGTAFDVCICKEGEGAPYETLKGVLSDALGDKVKFMVRVPKYAPELKMPVIVLIRSERKLSK